jgi:hypothetical protein
VSAINERLKKQKKDDKVKEGREEMKVSHEQIEQEDEVSEQAMLIQNGLAVQIENVADDDGEDIIGIFGARDQRFARRFLYFSTFEDMLFQMNGLNVSNLFGEGDQVLN